jgi:phage-related protein (TIGR01555 family)
MAEANPPEQRSDGVEKLAQRLAVTLDGWENALTGLGTTRDKRRSTAVSYANLSEQECEDFWRGDDMAAKVVEEPAREMTRRWLDVQVEQEDGDDSSTGKDAAEGAERELKRLKAKAALRTAIEYARAYGGAAILVGVNDGNMAPAMPLSVDSLAAVRFLNVFHRFECLPRDYYEEASEEKYGQPKTYAIRASAGAGELVVHESRILRVEGIRVSRRVSRSECSSWGDPIFVRIREVLEDFGASFGGVAHLMQDVSQAVFRMRGLLAALTGKQPELIKQRLEVMDAARSVLRAVVLDAGDGSSATEEFERKATPLAGVAEILDRMCNRLAAAADMPVTRLMGQSPAGLNASGETDTVWWYDHLEGLQGEGIEDPATELVRLIFLAKEGPTKGVEPENWSIKFRPLRQLTPLQEADRRLKIAQTDQAYVQAQVVMPEEIAISRFGGDEYSDETHIDKELREKMAAEPPEPEVSPDEELNPPEPDDEVDEE